MAKLLKSTTEVLYKPNHALVMVPKLGKLTLTSRKIFNILLHKTQQEVGVIRGQGRVVDAEHLFSAKLSDVLVLFGESDLRTLAKKYLKEMSDVKVDWEAPDAKEGVVWKAMGLLSEVNLEIRRGAYWVLWALPPSLLKGISDPSSCYFTPIALDNMARLSTYTAVALYEICIRYHNNPGGKTSSNSPDWWVDALTNAPASIDPATGQKRRREWRKLKSANVLDAILEINKETDIFITLEEHKSGKSVSEIQFTVERKIAEAKSVERPKVSFELATRAAEADISNDVLAGFIKDGRSESEITVALFKLAERMKMTSIEPIENKGAYLKSILKDLNGKLEIVSKMTPKAKAPDAPDQVDAAVDGVKPWAEQRRFDLKVAFRSLAKFEQKPFVDDAVSDLKQRKLLSAVTIRKIDDGDWSNPMLLSRAVELYAVATVGSNWLTEVAGV